MRVRLIATTVLFLSLVALALGVGGSREQARPRAARFAQARLIIEYNATDGDIGAQVFLDGEAWKSLRVFNPNGRKILDIIGTRSLQRQGLTELFFESSEPPLAQVPLSVFLNRFPEGVYDFEGVTIGGRPIEGQTMFTHAIPDPPLLLSPAEGSSQSVDSTVVSWNPVRDPFGSQIVAYQVIVVDFESPLPKRSFSVHVPDSVSSVTVPREFLIPGRHYEFEVLAIETNGNQTISSSAFDTLP